MSQFSRCIWTFIVCSALLANAQANEAAAHVNEWATVEGVVAKVFTSKSGNTFLNIGAVYPNQTFTGWIPPASPVSKSPVLSDIEGKKVSRLNKAPWDAQVTVQETPVIWPSSKWPS
jgi:hypothetical protein